jgi:predicted LPLAT superfamily acyltransferase
MIADSPGLRDTALPSGRPDWLRNRERGSTLLLRLMSMLSLRLGRPAGRVVLHVIAAYFFVFAPRARAHMRNYLRRALEREPAAADRYRLILSFATTIHDRVYLLRERFALLEITLEGDRLVAAHDAHSAGAFLMGAHFGSFEVTRALGRSRPGVRVAMAMYEQNARKLNAVIEALNPQLAIDIIPLGTLDSMLQIRARLEAGIFVGVLGDRSFGAEHYECVEFLGAPAWFPTGAMRAAALLHRPVIFMAGVYRGGNRYHILFEPLADFSHTAREQRETEVRLAVRRYAALLERLCRKDPYNWFNFFDFWQAPAVPVVAAVTTP